MNEIWKSVMKGSLDLHLLFLRIPKNASTSVYETLGQRNILNKLENWLEPHTERMVYRNYFSLTHARPDEIVRTFGNEARQYPTVAVVRDPFDRMVSLYSYAQRNELGNLYGLNNQMTFQQFCEVCWKLRDSNFIGAFPQTTWTHGCLEVHNVLRFENLAEDWRVFAGLYNLPETLPLRNKTQRVKNNPHNDTTKALTYELFEDDFVKLGY